MDFRIIARTNVNSFLFKVFLAFSATRARNRLGLALRCAAAALDEACAA
jgi:hypothetical protein